ncbi:MAG: hypothetical protein KIT36_07580 [Alphaproteobacteria bacterium]|nr:hypothetical protein [Alphaproteobacteria bacterium]
MDQGDVLRRVGEALFGERWLGELAQALEINERTIRRWAAGGFHVPSGVWRQISDLDQVRRRLADDQWQVVDTLGWQDDVRAEIGEGWNVLLDEYEEARERYRNLEVQVRGAFWGIAAGRHRTNPPLDLIEATDAAHAHLRAIQDRMAEYCEVNAPRMVGD